MRKRRIGFFLFWALSLWAVLYSGMAVYYYVFFLFGIVFVISVVQLILSYTSFGMRTNLSSHLIEKRQPFNWKLLPKARHISVAHVKISVEIPDITEAHTPHRDFYVSPSFRKATPVNLSIQSPYCGTLPLLVTGVEITDIFGLWRIKASPNNYLEKNPVYVTVLPDTTTFLPSDLLYDEIMLPVRKTRERAEAVGVREYMRGDNMRSIHWKYSARIGKLHVKEYEKGAKEMHLIYLDLTDSPLTGEAAMRAKDQMLCSAASLCHRLLLEQIPMIILGYSADSDGRFSLIHANAWEAARIYLAKRKFIDEVPSEYKELIAGYILAEKSTLTVFSMAVTADPLSFLTYRAGDYSSVSVCFIPQSGYHQEQQMLVHLCSDKGIQTTLLPLPTSGLKPPVVTDPQKGVNPEEPSPPAEKEGETI